MRPGALQCLRSNVRTQTVADLFCSGLITGKGLVTPIVPFERAPAALAAIFSRPETTIKVGVTF